MIDEMDLPRKQLGIEEPTNRYMFAIGFYIVVAYAIGFATGILLVL